MKLFWTILVCITAFLAGRHSVPSCFSEQPKVNIDSALDPMFGEKITYGYYKDGTPLCFQWNGDDWVDCDDDDWHELSAAPPPSIGEKFISVDKDGDETGCRLWNGKDWVDCCDVWRENGKSERAERRSSLDARKAIQVSESPCS